MANESRKEYDMNYHKQNREDQLWQMKMRHEEKYQEDIERFKKYNKEHKDEISLRKKTYYSKIRLETLLYYGNGKIECVCCGETEYDFMSIDHINGNGRKHLENLNASSICHWLKRYKYPKGYQLLCINCNMGKHRNGGTCPHKTKIPLLTIREEWSSN